MSMLPSLPTNKDLESWLELYDGRAMTLLSEARVACRNNSNYFDELIAFSFDPRPSVSDGATWMVKAELEEGAVLPPYLVTTLVSGLEKLKAWSAILHVCQIVDHLELTQEQAVVFSKWAKMFEDHERPFVRAWSIHARVVLSRRFEELREDGRQALVNAANDTAASVRARARQLQSKS